MSGPVPVSIIVPVLNEAEQIGGCLAALVDGFPTAEIVVVDGGSTDGTAARAGQCARVVTSPPGRGRQLNAGARASHGELLWFLHVDTRVAPGALATVQAALHDPRVVGGGLRLRFDRRSPALDAVRMASNLRGRLGWIFGDQAMFIRRWAYQAVGGFPDYPLMEDLEMSRRLRRLGKLRIVPATVTASTRRFDEHGTVRMVLLMQQLKLAYLCGADPGELARRYQAGPRRRIDTRTRPAHRNRRFVGDQLG